MEAFEHERVVMAGGRRSGLPIIVAVHSTALGPAIGGCRTWRYPGWPEAVADALRLSAAMTLKCAVAGLPCGGGKSVIALPSATMLTADRRRAVFLDLGDLVESLGGEFGVSEDVGTTAQDLLVAREQTAYAYGLPTSAGGIGEPAAPTAVGVHSAIKVTCARLFGSPMLAGRKFTIIGTGQVGSRLAGQLAADGASLLLSDIDPAKRVLAEELGAAWAEPDEALTKETELLVPAALGGLLTQETVETLRCKAIVGPANNQLADDVLADRLADRRILWAPDFVVNAGGVIYGVTVEVGKGSTQEAMARVRAIGETLSQVYALADANGITPSAAAHRLAGERIATAPRPSAST